MYYLSLDGMLAVAAVFMAIVLTVLAFIFLVPEKRRSRMNGFGKFLHDTLNFRYLIVEKILQACYIFLTCLAVLTGFFMLFKVDYWGNWQGFYGLLLMVIGPLAIRLVYELAMMLILLVKNVISINNKLAGKGTGDDPFAAPDMDALRGARAYRPAAPSESTGDGMFHVPDLSGAEGKSAHGQDSLAQLKFCTVCGSKLDDNGNCPNCGGSAL